MTVTLEHINCKLDALTAMLIKSKGIDFVSKPVFMAITGWASRTVNNRVSEGHIKKRGCLYSLKSYEEYNELLALKAA